MPVAGVVEGSDRRLLVTYLLGFVSVGLALSFVGPALTYLTQRVGTNEAGMGWVFFGVSTGYTAAAPLAGRVLDRGDGHRMWMLASAAMLAALVVMVAARSLAVLIGGGAVAGGSAALIDVSGNTLTVWLSRGRPGRRINALHLCFALGAISTPLVVRASLHVTGGLALLPAFVAVLLALTTPQLLAHAAPARLARHDDSGGGAPQPALVVLCVYFLTYVALETVFAGWLTRYAERVGARRISATAIIVVFWVFFALGRLLAMLVAARLGARTLVVAATCASVLGAIGFAVWRATPSMWWATVAVFALSIAPQYASMIGYAETRLALTGRDTSIIVAMSGIGGLLGPWAMGQAFTRWGPFSLPFAELVLSALNVVALIAVIVRLEATAAGAGAPR